MSDELIDLTIDRDEWKQRAEWAEQSARERWECLEKQEAELVRLREQVNAYRRVCTDLASRTDGAA